MTGAWKVRILQDGEEKREIDLNDEMLIGRSSACQIHLNDQAISREHVQLRLTKNGVEALKRSRFAPFKLNGIEKDQTVIQHGDRLEVGPFELIFSALDDLSRSEPVAQEEEIFPEASPDLDSPLEPAPLSEGVGDEQGDDFGDNFGDNFGDERDDRNERDEMSEIEALGEPLPSLEESLAQDQPIDFDSDLPMEIMADEIISDEMVGFEESAGEDSDEKTSILPQQTIQAKLILPPGRANVHELDLTKAEVVIGRSRQCDIVLNDRKSSREHVKIKRLGMRFILEDCGSGNGTYVNGEKLEGNFELSGEDIIQIGDTEIQFQALDASYVENQEEFISLPEDEPDFDFDHGGGVPLVGSSGMPGMQTPDFGEVPGLSYQGSGGATPKSLLGKFKAMPREKRLKILAGIVIAFFLYDELFPSEPTGPRPQREIAAEQIEGDDEPSRDFESLSPDQQNFVRNQHAMSFDLFKNKEFDKSLYEIQKIFELVEDYKDSRQIERYALEGKRRIEAIEEERRRKEQLAKLTARIAELEARARKLMDDENYDEASVVFPEILAIDPENRFVARSRATIDAYYDDKRLQEQLQAAQDRINREARIIFEQGLKLKDEGNCHQAMQRFSRVPDTGTNDQTILAQAKKETAECLVRIQERLEPVLQQARENEGIEEYAEAFRLYREATEIDPSQEEGYQGMDRIRGVLHQRAKALYTEAVLAESYSDFDLAREKFEACLDVAPEDDEYYGRAQRKLSRYYIRERGLSSF
jgi:pSer/pThr/pTyr-binding forkhead associated (FHA) protein/tetratricopeptide (TPR) repeat protein